MKICFFFLFIVFCKEKELFDLINKYRIKNGLNKLNISSELQDISLEHNKLQRNKNKIKHLFRKEKKLSLRLKKKGFKSDIYSEVIGISKKRKTSVIFQNMIKDSNKRKAFLKKRVWLIGISSIKKKKKLFWTIILGDYMDNENSTPKNEIKETTGNDSPEKKSPVDFFDTKETETPQDKKLSKITEKNNETFKDKQLSERKGDLNETPEDPIEKMVFNLQNKNSLQKIPSKKFEQQPFLKKKPKTSKTILKFFNLLKNLPNQQAILYKDSFIETITGNYIKASFLNQKDVSKLYQIQKSNSSKKKIVFLKTKNNKKNITFLLETCPNNSLGLKVISIYHFTQEILGNRDFYVLNEKKKGFSFKKTKNKTKKNIFDLDLCNHDL